MKKKTVRRSGGPVVLYHRTTAARWRRIRAVGFRDGRGHYGLDVEVSGVWLSDRPLDFNSGAEGDVLLRVEMTITRAQLRRYEVQQPGQSYREYLFPAAFLNANAKPRRTQEDKSVWPLPEEPAS
jgi:hypothetical protein